MRDILLGRFYFKLTSNGNLVGEFSNNIYNGIYTESADSIDSTHGYLGKYKSTWQENRNPDYAILKISHKPNTNRKIFVLKWIRKGKPIFKGEGMLCENILIGDYQEEN
jgi:hypothetical protein